MMHTLENKIKELNIVEYGRTLDLFHDYMEYVLEWNQKVNLTAITDRDEFIAKHFIDSLTIVSSKEFQEAERIIDVGTGGGFPGMPLALIAPQKKFVLMDSLKKRLNIIEGFCVSNDINNVQIVHSRAEDLAQKDLHREKYDLVTSRAVAAMTTLAEYCLPFVKVGGNFVAYKGPEINKELDDGAKAIKILGGKLTRIERTADKRNETNHNLVFISKINKTPKAYPRKAGTPIKQPL